MDNALRTLRMVYRPRRDATPGWTRRQTTSFAPSFLEVEVVGGAGVARALRQSPPIGEERSEREVAGPGTREVGVGGGRVIVDA
jgi:hypothetical protein